MPTAYGLTIPTINWLDQAHGRLFTFTLAPAMVKIALGLVIVITVSTFLCRPGEKPELTPAERYAEWIEENLDRHALSDGVEFYDQKIDMTFHRHQVEPGSYTLDIYKSDTTDNIVLLHLARGVKENSNDNQLVYLFGNRVFRLHTQNEEALQDLAYDLAEEIKGDCQRMWGARRCGWLVR